MLSFLKWSARLFAALTFLCSTHSFAAEGVDGVDLPGGVKLQLNGMGVARELSGELYIGALYGEQRTNNGEFLVRNDVSKRMALRIVADRLYATRFVNSFRTLIGINNDKQAVQMMSDEVLDFFAAFNTNMVAGDQINFDYQPGKGTRITLNGVELATIKKPEFMGLLIRCWTGERAPSVQFRQGVLGEADSATLIAVQERYSLLKPTSARVTEVRNSVDKKAAAFVPSGSDSPSVAAKPEVKKEEPKKAEVKVAPSNPSPAPVTVATKPADSKIAADNKTVPQGGDKEVSATASDGTEMAMVERPEASASASDRLNEYYARRDYERKLLAHIGQFKEYPWDRLRRKYGNDLVYNPKQGKAIVRVTISREGLVKSSKVEQSTGDRILDDAAIAMVDRANPLPIMPSKLTDPEFEFLVEVLMSPGKID